MRPILLAIVLILATPGFASHALASPEAIAALKEGGRILLLRHAQTHSGIGDPSNFDIADCSTQRNLDHRGHAQAERFGKALKAAGVRIERALSSGWCRCLDTATLILKAADQSAVPVETFEPLNSFFEDREARDRRVREANAAVAAWSGDGVLLMSTHMVNILGMTGRSLVSGGYLVIEPNGDGYEIVASGRP